MSEYYLFNSLTEMKKETNGEWPIHWVSAKGLEEAILTLGDDVIGCEVGSCYGWSLVYLLENAPNISKIYAVDPYAPYDASTGGIDNGGVYMTQEIQNKIKELWFENTISYSNRTELIQKSSSDAALDFEDGFLDFVFIDGDHSYSAVKKDIATYYPKIRSGGIVAGHDYSFPDVKNALKEFLEKHSLDESILKFGQNDSWYFFK